jgi:glycosyltransferase involved in cell wall biosynthesis
MLIDEGHQVDVAFNIEQEVNSEIYDMGCKKHQLPLQRSPLKKDNFRAYKMLKSIIISEGYDLVHTHTPVASAVVRLVCRNLNNVRVFYTAHGFHFFKGASLINWIVYYPIEKWLAKYTDTLITINKEDYKIAQNKLKPNKVEYIQGIGIDIKRYSNLNINKSLKRKEIGVPVDSLLILSIGELNKNKNHEIVIRALAEINDKKIHYVICGKGHLKEHLNNLSLSLGLEKNVHILGYREDIAEICNIADIFIFPSFREGLPVALMEAMATGLPVICSKIRGNVDLIENNVNGFTFETDDIATLVSSIFYYEKNKNIVDKFSENSKSVINDFSLSNVINQLRNIYKNFLEDYS